jgi:hypothetical protein
MPAFRELLLRITVEGPAPGARFQLQRGTGDLEPPIRVTRESITFEFPVRLGERPDGSPNFLGPFAQGPPAGRFVYVNSGTLAGQSDSCWTRRAKIPLTAITWREIREAHDTGGVLETRIAGTSGDGGPACGTVPLRTAWRVTALRP